MRRYVLLALPMLVSGCALPPAVIIASYAADGVSYLASGKSLEDHGLSAALDQDCALHRVLMEKPICSDFKPADATATTGSPPVAAAGAAKDPAPSPETVAAAPPVVPTTPTEFSVAPPPPPQRPPAPVAAPVPTNAAVAPPPPPRPPAPAADTGPRRYLVLGSFSERENAARFARQLGQPGLAVVSVKLEGRTVYRVVAGPLAVTRVADLRARLAAKGAGDTWEVASLPPG